MQVFKSEYLFNKAQYMMKKKGYAVATKSVWCGEITVTWRKL